MTGVLVQERELEWSLKRVGETSRGESQEELGVSRRL